MAIDPTMVKDAKEATWLADDSKMNLVRSGLRSFKNTTQGKMSRLAVWYQTKQRQKLLLKKNWVAGGIQSMRQKPAYGMKRYEKVFENRRVGSSRAVKLSYPGKKFENYRPPQQ